MPSIYQLKPGFQRLLAPLLNALIRSGISPNQITLLAMSLSLLFGAALAYFGQAAQNRWLWAAFPFAMLLRMAMNAIDGMLANATGNKTRLGALLNELCDQISDAALYLPFALLPGIAAPLLVVTVVLALLAEFAGVAAVLVGTARRFDGPMGKSDRAFAFGLLALLAYFQLAPLWLNSLLALVLLLAACTVINRLRLALAPAP
ncbi:CDP-alcohol phosphatidyltransferase family protein [Undibacterium sp.]|uniref:CDP-alcohol phosphatidyltransferase family protein n=1 Tax=Undibacterium sp. TaxID=1914977 RepID=UPI00374D8299